MPKWLKGLSQWIGHAEVVQAILHTEFVRTALWSTLVTIMTGSAGVLGGVPLMWVFMASAVAFGAVTTGLLRGSEYLERKNPQNKLAYLGTYFQADLEPVDIPPPLFGNRQQRRAQRVQNQPIPQLSSSQVMAGVSRVINKGQISIAIRNTASFPISFFIESADTEVQGIKPPRSPFPKPKVILLPGNMVRIFDDPIEMDGYQCQRMAGKMDFKIRYGLPGKEHFELHLIANLDIQMETFGFVTAVGSEWLA